MTIYDFNVVDIHGKNVSLKEYQGKVLLIVNVASKCGFAPQYKGLERLYKDFGPDKFAVLGFPCNQFLNQEPGTNEEILNFCQSTYDVSFPMFSKVDVNGDHTHPLYQYLKEAAKGVFGTTLIKWNFTKFLVNSSGQVIKRFDSATPPEAIREDIEKLLYKQARG